MFGAVATIFLYLLLPQVSGLITTDAKCLAGYEWMFSSIHQSPCDVAAELASVCVGGQFNLEPLDPGYIYLGPTRENANGCRCSSVYYSLLSGCSYCQGRNYLGWSVYASNCSTAYLTVYNQLIPVGVKVPAYAYQDVSIGNTFDVSLAQSMKGVESTRPPGSSSTPGLRSIPTSSATVVGSGGNGSGSSNSTRVTTNNTPAIVGGVVGGIIGLGLIAALIAFLLIRSKKEPAKSLNYDSSFQLSNMASTSPLPSARSPPPGSPDVVSSSHDPRLSIFTPNDPNMLVDPQRQHSPPLNQHVLPNYTGNTQNQFPNQPIPQNTDVRVLHYTGMPEV